MQQAIIIIPVYPFRLKFDKCVDNQRFLGLDELVLTNSLGPVLCPGISRL